MLDNKGNLHLSVNIEKLSGNSQQVKKFGLQPCYNKTIKNSETQFNKKQKIKESETKKMRKTNNYTINREDSTITITREFAKRSGIINSDEYNLLTQFLRDNPGYKVVQRTAAGNKGKNTHKGLTLDNMRKYLATRDNAADALKAFETAQEYYKGYSAYYAKVKAWFLDNYKEDYEKYAPAAAVPAENVGTAANGSPKTSPALLDEENHLNNAA